MARLLEDADVEAFLGEHGWVFALPEPGQRVAGVVDEHEDEEGRDQQDGDRVDDPPDHERQHDLRSRRRTNLLFAQWTNSRCHH